MLHFEWQYCRVAIFHASNITVRVVYYLQCGFASDQIYRGHFAFSPLEVGIFGCRKVLVCSNMMVEYYYCVEHTTAARSVVSLLTLGALYPTAARSVVSLLILGALHPTAARSVVSLLTLGALYPTAARSVVSLLILGALYPIAFALSAGESGWSLL